LLYFFIATNIFIFLGELEHLDFSHNLFKEIPIISGNLELLKDLKEWDVGIGLLNFLRTLNFSHNKLAKWPPQLENLNMLNKLNFSHNQIERIDPDSLGALKQLNNLDVSFNQLMELPSSIYDIPLHVSYF
jgi:Leucine-rich repeat (LRR) protein